MKREGIEEDGGEERDERLLGEEEGRIEVGEGRKIEERKGRRLGERG